MVEYPVANLTTVETGKGSKMGKVATDDMPETGAVSLLDQIIGQTLEALAEREDFDEAAVARLREAARHEGWAKPEEVAAALAEKEGP